ncbi:unnamed protein product [Phytophthora lilii]|uniref:RxLR effector protein n=1 Tax=Phytophthora lilii TaxID=2077276 RepID=A0A9W6TQZ4_9STRA|nr:unnamed protein product [Phytophthora lilii]
MHFHYVLLVAAAILAATTTTVLAVDSAESLKITFTDQVYSNQRSLRTFDTNTVNDEDDTENLASKKGHFMENKLQKALTNPKKTKKLYAMWYKKGYTAEQVSSNLSQNENRELNKTYKNLYSGYKAYIKEKDAL